MAYVRPEEKIIEDIFSKETLPPETPLPLPIEPVFNGIYLKTGQFSSPNYAKSRRGWMIDSDGNAEFENGVFRGTFVLGGTLITVNKFSEIQPAINKVSLAGGGIVNIEPGTYIANSSITIPSNVTLDGNGATIDFNGGAYQVLIQGTNAYATGSINATFGSTTITGSGITAWNSSMIGQSILIGDYWYTISGVTNTNTATLSGSFIGTNLTNDTYVIATTINGSAIQNITLTNASGTLLRFRYCNGLNINTCIFTRGGQGIDGDDSANVNLQDGYTIDNCALGITYDNVPFCVFKSGLISNITAGTGLALTRVTNTALDSLSIQAITGVGTKLTNCANFGFSVFSIIECTSHGMELVSGNNDVDIISGYVNTCGGDGIKLTATSDRTAITDVSILNNTGWGINIAASTCDNNTIVSNAFSGNGSGTITDSGTSTVAKANQGATDIPSTTLAFKSGTSSKDASDASTTQNIAHGLGKTPTSVNILALAPTAGAISKTTYNGTTQSSIAMIYTGVGTLTARTTFDLNTNTGAGLVYQGGVVTFDATNIIITWTKNSTPTGTYQLLWEAIG